MIWEKASLGITSVTLDHLLTRWTPISWLCKMKCVYHKVMKFCVLVLRRHSLLHCRLEGQRSLTIHTYVSLPIIFRRRKREGRGRKESRRRGGRWALSDLIQFKASLNREMRGPRFPNSLEWGDQCLFYLPKSDAAAPLPPPVWAVIKSDLTALKRAWQPVTGRDMSKCSLCRRGEWELGCTDTSGD